MRGLRERLKSEKKKEEPGCGAPGQDTLQEWTAIHGQAVGGKLELRVQQLKPSERAKEN